MARYICKSCGRKREEYDLKIVGSAHNTQNVWLCKDGSEWYTGCDKPRWNLINEHKYILGRLPDNVQLPPLLKYTKKKR